MLNVCLLFAVVLQLFGCPVVIFYAQPVELLAVHTL